MKITTGFGYYVKDGKKLRRYNLPLGDHPDPVGHEFVEVANQLELNAIVLDKSDEQIAREQKHINKQALKYSAIAKLTALGLTSEEALALIG